MPLRFSVFGDVHGRVPLMILLSRAWQDANDQPLDGILQVGDMGAFPDHTRLDKATARFAAHDPDELDFVHFIDPTPLAHALLDDPDTPPIAFCRGNHEDFEYLGRYRRVSSLDPFHRLWFVPDGEIMQWRGPSDVLHVGAFGGAPPHPTRSTTRQKRRALGPRFRVDDVERAFLLGGVDILLTHAGPEHPAFPAGCPHLAALAERLRPRAHLFGHHHEVVGPVHGPDGSLLVGLEHLEFVSDGTLRPGSWGILEVSDSDASFRWMDAHDQPWMAPFRRRHWRALLPR